MSVFVFCALSCFCFVLYLMASVVVVVGLLELGLLFCFLVMFH